ncbi:hypothetical protein HanLR1_Chr10g0366981 [Helianthus annuus]|nr:hypothetical protein HanLR1_Chr10g0366981 [Helianthus annuus]
MTTPSKPSSPPRQASPPSSSVAEEEVEDVEADKSLPVFKWKYPDFRQLMTTVQMPEAYGATYPQDGDTAAGAPAGMVTMFADFFGYLRMMLRNKPGVKKKLVVKEKDKVVRFWRSFADDFEGKIVVEKCGEGEEGW